MTLTITQETYLYDGDHGGEHICRCCSTEFSTAELEDDPGLWYVVGGFELLCGACDDGQRADREMAADALGDR